MSAFPSLIMRWAEIILLHHGGWLSRLSTDTTDTIKTTLGLLLNTGPMDRQLESGQ